MSTCKWRLKPGDIIEYSDCRDPTTFRAVFRRYDVYYPGILYVARDGFETHLYGIDLTLSRVIRYKNASLSPKAKS